MTNPPYGFGCTVAGSIADVRTRVEAALGAQGFGVLTEIDMSATLKKKLNLDVRPYLILGACNPALASRALEAEPMIGLLLPCNVLLQENRAGLIDVSIADPAAMLQMASNEALADMAADAEAALRRVVADLV